MPVREMNKEDKQVFVELWEQFLEEMYGIYKTPALPEPSTLIHFSNTFRGITEGFIDGTVLGYSLEPGGPIVGLAMATLGSDTPYPERWKLPYRLQGIFVHADHRHAGAWRELYERGVQEAKRLGASHVLGMVDTGNFASEHMQEEFEARQYASLWEREL